MDALPIAEETSCSFSSNAPGLMHACGHDFHMAAALGAAMLLAQKREQLPGNVLFLFQPDEEGDGGAQRMIREGCLDAPHVDAVFGMHVCPDLPKGTAGFRFGKFYAASNPFSIQITGRACHGAEPEKGISALQTAAELIGRAEELRQDLIRRFGPTIISFGILRAGTAGNIIPERAEVFGIIRTLGEEARNVTTREFRQLAEAVCEKHGAQLEISIKDSYPGIVNHDAETEFAGKAAEALLGKDAVIQISQPTMTTEDFGYYLLERPGAFWHFGVGGEYPLHNSHFLPDQELLPLAAALHAHILTCYLEEK